MTHRIARLKTKHANRYLQQLCTHFGHKVPVRFNGAHGRIDLPFGTCLLDAEGDALTMRLESAEAEIGRLERVIGDHIARFAFRENPVIAWRPAA
ncbi:MAG: DUF2218 domain-containing protein [Pseudomonadota bacterium]